LKNIILILLLLLVSSCITKRDENFNISTPLFSKVNYRIDTILIPIDSVTSNKIFVFDHFQSEHTEVLFYYNSNNHIVYGFDLNKNEYQYMIQLSYDGENGVGTVESLHVHNLDSIFLYERGIIKIINLQGRVKTSFNLIRGMSDDFGFVFANHTFRLNFIPKIKSVLLNNIYGMQNRSHALEMPFAAICNFSDRKIYAVPIMYSDYLKNKRGDFGYHWGVNMLEILDDGRVVYTFPPESNIYTHNLLTEKNDSYAAPSKFTKSTVPPLESTSDRIKIRKHLIENPTYYGVMFDRYKNLFYRIHRGGREFTTNDDGNELRDVNFYITVFDSNLNYIDEIELPKNNYIQFVWFVTSKGLCFNAASNYYASVKENFIQLHAYIISPE